MHSIIAVGQLLLLLLLPALGLVVAVEFLLDDGADVLPAVLLQRVDLRDVAHDVPDLVRLPDLHADAAPADREHDLEQLHCRLLHPVQELGSRRAAGLHHWLLPNAVLKVVSEFPVALVAALHAVDSLLVAPHCACLLRPAHRPPSASQLRLEGALFEFGLHPLGLSLPLEFFPLLVLVASIEPGNEALLLLH
jgi:hypothetical protein